MSAVISTHQQAARTISKISIVSDIYKGYGKIDGSHAIRLLGWGEENGEKYWIAANTYGPGWGDNGFFKIPRGSNYMHVENMLSAVFPREAYNW